VQAPSLSAAFGLFGLTGLDTNIINAQTINYTIVTGDAGHTIYVTGGPFTVTLPSVSGFVGNEPVRVCNGNANANTSHAVLLSGFPNPVFPRLYPRQCVSVAIESGPPFQAASVQHLRQPSSSTTAAPARTTA
jgi:hypothetical protein